MNRRAPLFSQNPRLYALSMVLVVVFTASAVRLLTYIRYLPHNDYSDEVVYVALADEVRGFSDQTSLRERYGEIAPLYVYTNVAVHALHDLLKTHPWHIPGEYLYSLRLLSVCFGVCTALALAWIGWLLAGKGAALVSGLIWALSPIIVSYNSLAIPDPMLYLLCALAVGSALAALKQSSLRLLALSLACGIAAIYLKLWIGTAILPFVVVSILLLLRDRTRLPRIVLMYGIGALFALHFVLVLNPLENTLKVNATVEGNAFLTDVMNPERLLNNLRHLVYPVDAGIGLAYGVLLLGAAALVYSRRSGVKSPGASSLLVVGVYVVSTWWLSAGVSFVNLDNRMRHILPATAAFIPLWAAFAVQLLRACRHFLSQRRVQPSWIAQGVAALLLLALLSGFIVQDAQLAAVLNRPHTTNTLLRWFDGSPPHDGWVLLPSGSEQETLWNRLWGAYLGSKPYEWWVESREEIPLSTPAEYLARDIRWLVLNDSDFVKTRDPQALRSYADQLLLVKTIPSVPDRTAGEQYYVYRLEAPGYPAAFSFGQQLELVGYDLSAASLRAGDTLHFRPYWRLEQLTARNLSFYLHVYSAESVNAGTPMIAAQWDGEPLTNGNRPTSLWDDTAEVYFGEPLALTIPPETPPGDYLIAVGLYDYLTQERMTGTDGAPYFSIPLTINAPPQA